MGNFEDDSRIGYSAGYEVEFYGTFARSFIRSQVLFYYFTHNFQDFDEYMRALMNEHDSSESLSKSLENNAEEW